LSRAPVVSCLLTSLVLLAAGSPLAGEADAPPTVGDAYPDVATGALATAALADLPDGVLLRARGLEIASASLDAIIARAPEAARPGLRKSALLMLDELATEKLLLLATGQDAPTGKPLTPNARKLIAAHLDRVASSVQVTDAEVADFYADNKDTFGKVSLEKVKDTVTKYLMDEKRQDAVRRHIQGLGKAHGAVVSRSWTAEHARLVRDNPVDKARASGRPSLVDFGADGCRPCDKMAPILERLKKKYAGRANVVFVHVRRDPVLASRFGIRSIPVQIFYDRSGKEVFRHTGYFAERAIVKQLASMGVQ